MNCANRESYTQNRYGKIYEQCSAFFFYFLLFNILDISLRRNFIFHEKRTLST